jgi:hypothetical protein
VLLHLGQGKYISSPLAAPTSVWEESLSDQLPSSAVVTFRIVVRPKPRVAGLVARPGSTTQLFLDLCFPFGITLLRESLYMSCGGLAAAFFF